MVVFLTKSIRYQFAEELCTFTWLSAGRLEMEEQGYEQSYILNEQARLNALGYGYNNW